MRPIAIRPYRSLDQDIMPTSYTSLPSCTAYDFAIVGGGIVGLATAREVLRRRPDLRLLLVEKEPILASHQTGHNSGVLHAGIYYQPGSLKAQACVAGRRELIAYCEEKSIPYQECGKLIVALDETELPRLDMLHQRGTRQPGP
jgi:L-2-hydroxyglutarate oxidase LhgO